MKIKHLKHDSLPPILIDQRENHVSQGRAPGNGATRVYSGAGTSTNKSTWNGRTYGQGYFPETDTDGSGSRPYLALHQEDAGYWRG